MTAPALPGAAPDPFDASLAALDVEPRHDAACMVTTYDILGLDAVRAAHRAEFAALSARVAKLEAEQSEARNRAARLEAALRFYADPANYRNRVVETSTGTHSVPWSMPIESDIGDKARAALEAKP